MGDKKIEDLQKEIKKLQDELYKVKSCKRYGLVWEEKPEIFEEKAKDALPILKEDKSLRIEDSEEKPNNIIIEGDNYHSLSALSYTHKGKIDVIYIDPPYNTGNKDFIYNDSFVDKEDTYRHSKWLSFMNKRLKLAKDLLSDDGVIFISIDDNEFAQLKLLCQEHFLESFVDNFIWRKAEGKLKNTTTFRKEHEYILVCYKKNKNLNRVLLKLKEKLKKDSFNLKVNIGKEKSGYFYTIKNEGNKWEGYWKYSEEEMNKMIKKGEVIFKGKNVPRGRPINKPVLLDSILNIGSSSAGKRELELIFKNFNDNFTPKPIELIKLILKLSSKLNSTILDFFAGSGTTGHAVMELNREDLGNRQFILCSSRENTKDEPEKNICRDITYERNKRVIKGYTDSKGKKIEGLGGNLSYYTNEFIKIEESIDDLRDKFMDMCDDLLCIKENTFSEFDFDKNIDELKVFRRKDKYAIILYDMYYFDDLLEIIEKLNGEIVVYLFTQDKTTFEEELSYLEKNISIANIPDDILETYKKIFNF